MMGQSSEEKILSSKFYCVKLSIPTPNLSKVSYLKRYIEINSKVVRGENCIPFSHEWISYLGRNFLLSGS